MSFASFFDNHFIISRERERDSSRTPALFVLSDSQKKILAFVCAQFINYNFRIIYQIEENGNLVPFLLRFWDTSEESTSTRSGRERNLSASTSFQSHVSYMCLLIAFRSLCLCRHCHCIIHFFSTVSFTTLNSPLSLSSTLSKRSFFDGIANFQLNLVRWIYIYLLEWQNDSGTS